MIAFGVPAFRRYDLLAKLMASVDTEAVDRIVVVDNGCQLDASAWPARVLVRLTVISPGRNVGVAGAWNLLVDDARAAGAERVVISNDDIELRPTTLGRVLAEPGDVVRAPGFALFALRPRVVESTGYFDENFFPAYFEDNDYVRRCVLSGIQISDPQGVEIHHEGSATLKSLSTRQQARFGQRFVDLRVYYVTKWGGPPGREAHRIPFAGRPPRGWQERPVTRGGLRPTEPWLA